MINKVAFTGRETMLTNGLKNASNKANEFISASSVLPALPKVNVAKSPANDLVEAVYTSPFAPTGNAIAKELADEAAATQRINLYI